MHSDGILHMLEVDEAGPGVRLLRQELDVQDVALHAIARLEVDLDVVLRHARRDVGDEKVARRRVGRALGLPGALGREAACGVRAHIPLIVVASASLVPPTGLACKVDVQGSPSVHRAGESIARGLGALGSFKIHKGKALLQHNRGDAAVLGAGGPHIVLLHIVVDVANVKTFATNISTALSATLVHLCVCARASVCVCVARGLGARGSRQLAIARADDADVCERLVWAPCDVGWAICAVKRRGSAGLRAPDLPWALLASWRPGLKGSTQPQAAGPRVCYILNVQAFRAMTGSSERHLSEPGM